jgi:ribosome-binding factor A
MKEKRLERLNEELKKEISTILREDIKDPRLSATVISIVNVKTSNDLSYTDVYVSMLGDQKQIKDSMAAILSAAGYIRKLVGQRIEIRRIPELRFQYNDYIEQGIRIGKLIDEVSRNSKPTE